jgi:hypothetical protein
MKWSEWLEKWSMSSLQIKTGFLEMEWKPKDADKDAAWELFIELLTRVTTQPLPEEHGVEATALDSVYQIFGLTRSTLKNHGRHCVEFTKIAVVVLNQVIRPFTAKWHKEMASNSFEKQKKRDEFRAELASLQTQLRNYMKMLSHMAGVESLAALEECQTTNASSCE